MPIIKPIDPGGSISIGASTDGTSICSSGMTTSGLWSQPIYIGDVGVVWGYIHPSGAGGPMNLTLEYVIAPEFHAVPSTSSWYGDLARRGRYQAFANKITNENFMFRVNLTSGWGEMIQFKVINNGISSGTVRLVIAKSV